MSLEADSGSLRYGDVCADVAEAPVRDERSCAAFDIPCVSSPCLSKAFGADISICDVTLGPTSSWKDCVAPGVVETTVGQGLRRVVVASSGNHGRAIAFACRAAGLQSAVLVYERTASDVVASLRALGAKVVLFHDRSAVYTAMEALISDGWFSATLTDQSRKSGAMPGCDGYRRIAKSIASAVPGDPIVVVPTCYGDGATAIRRHLIQLGRKPTMCLVRASESTGGVATSIATDVLTPQVSRLLESGAITMRIEDQSFHFGIRMMEEAVAKPLDRAEGGIPEALRRLVASTSGFSHRPIVCVVTGAVYPGLDYDRHLI